MFKINNNKFKLIALSIIMLVLFNISWTAQAIVISNENNATVINKVKASAATGDNQADSGEVVEGQAKSSVKVKTIINDQVVEDIDIEETTAGGEASVKVESRVEADNDKAVVETTTEINDEETTKKQVIDLAGDQCANGSLCANDQATAAVISAEPDEDNPEKETASDTEEAGEENVSAPTENIIAKIFINIFNAFKSGILKIFSLFA